MIKLMFSGGLIFLLMIGMVAGLGLPQPIAVKVIPNDQTCDVIITNTVTGQSMSGKTQGGELLVDWYLFASTGDVFEVKVKDVTKTFTFKEDVPSPIQEITVVCEKICPEPEPCPIIECPTCPPEKICPTCEICPEPTTCPPLKDNTVEDLLSALGGAIVAGTTVFIYKNKKGKVTTKVKKPKVITEIK